MFIILLTYTKPVEEVDRLLPDHVAFLDKYFATGHFLTAGRRNPRTGGVILCRAESRDEAERIAAEDPFQAVADYEVIEFIPTRYSKEFETIIK